MSALPGIGGSLFPARYLIDRLSEDAARPDAAVTADRARRFERWWRGVAYTCGPASGLRAVFDLAAMPLFGLLGFRARHAVFDPDEARARLDAPGGAALALVIRRWSERPSALWKTPTTLAREMGANWCFLFAPPFLSLLDACGRATRRSVEFAFPAAIEPPSFDRFWALAHAGAFDDGARRAHDDLPRGDVETSSIDWLVRRAAEFQDRVRDDLRHGVADAIGSLAAVMPRTSRPRTRLGHAGRGRNGPAVPVVTAADEALAIIYRILFLLFAESRDLVPHAHRIYARAYGMAALCRDALAGRHLGLWDGLAAVTRLSRLGCRTDDLVVVPFNGHLFARRAAPTLEAGRVDRRVRGRVSDRDEAMGRALVALGSRRGDTGREAISYRDLGVEQLGAVYEHVLDLIDRIDGRIDGVPARDTADEPAKARAHQLGVRRDFTAVAARHHSARRKETGTFYTPQPLAEFVVRRTLGPLVVGLPADAILSLRVVDPAMGSGAFLVAACHFLAHAYEQALIDEGRIGPADLDDEMHVHARRLVAERCLAGVDRNPVAVQLARLSLWLTTLARDKPLGFLDHRLRVGDSLVGASPDDLARLPARVGRRSQSAAPSLPLFDADDVERVMSRVVAPLASLSAGNDTVEAVRAKESLWRHLNLAASPLATWRLALAVWCARWFWPSDRGGPPPPAEHRAILDALLNRDRMLPAARLADRLAAADLVARDARFFHWPLEFADVFYDADGRPKPNAGFDAVIGNPPWEMARDDDAGSRTRQSAQTAASRRGLVRFIRESGLYRACGRGHVNLYQPFVERALALARPGGRVGLVLPWGLSTDEGAADLRTLLLERSAVDVLVGCDNAARLFPIHRGLRFGAIVTRRGGPTTRVHARFGVKTAAELDELPAAGEESRADAFPVTLTPERIARVGGAARRIPDARRASDLAFLERVMTAFPRLGAADGWRARFSRELNATDDRHLFGTGAAGLPVIDGKHLVPFRARTDAPTSRIDRPRAFDRFPDARFDRRRLGYRDVSGVGNRLSLIAAVIPGGVLTTHTIFCLRTPVSPRALFFLCGLLNSYVLNTVVRLLMGGHVTTALVEDLPAPVWTPDVGCARVAALARRLSHASPPSPDAAGALQADVAKLYGLDARQFRDLLDGFPLVPAEDRERAARAFEIG